jgi:glycosyltransferase involved in cell wall biosynthesis
MSAQPTVSVLTPSYQYASFLGDTLASVAGQARLEEHIVFDGGSTDGTVELLAEQPNGKLFWKSAPDDGQSDALNHALDHAGGDWIGWLNADEFYLPGALEAAMQVASATGADVVVGSSVFVDETGHLIRLLETHPYSHRVLKYYGCYLLSSSVFIRRAVLPAEPWDVQLRTVMDWDLFLRLASTGARFASTRRPMSAFRVHRAQVTAMPMHRAHPERRRVQTRYGINTRWTRRALGTAEHVARRVAGGSYAAERRTRRAFVGADMRWFEPYGSPAADALVRAVAK